MSERKNSAKHNTLMPLFGIAHPFNSILFYSLLAIAGINYDKFVETRFFPVIMVIWFGLSVLYYIYTVGISVWDSRSMYLIIGIFSSTVIGLLQILQTHSYDYEYAKYFFLYWVLCFSPLVWGMYLGSRYKETLPLIFRWVEVINLIITVTMVISVFVPFATRKFGSRYNGAINYQSASYYSAFAFGMNLFYLINWDYPHRFKIFRNKLYLVILIFFQLLLSASAIIPGGRGGFVLLFVYAVLGVIYWFIKNRKNSIKIIAIILIGILLILMIIPVVDVFLEIPSFNTGIQRALEFIDFGEKKLNLEEGSSGRAPIYRQAVQLILERPFFGYGLFSYMYDLTTINQYPHNLFLEILLQGGLLYFGIFLWVSLAGLRKFKALVCEEPSFMIILFLVTFPLVLLMFSGTYLTEPLLWYSCAILYAAKVEKNNGKVMNHDSI
jgi:O-antigen ligase